MSKKNPKITIKDMIFASELLIGFSKELTFEAYKKDYKTQFAAERCLEVIGEAAKRLPQEFKDLHPGIPWKNIAGLRDIVIHMYDNLDYKLIWDAITTKVPELLEKLKKIDRELK